MDAAKIEIGKELSRLEYIEKRVKEEFSLKKIPIDTKEKLDIKREALNDILFELELPTLDDPKSTMPPVPITFEDFLKYAQKNESSIDYSKDQALIDQTCFIAESYNAGGWYY